MKIPMARIAIAAVTVGLVTACGSGPSTTTGSSSSSAPGGFPRTVDHAMGTTGIPAQPRRIAALDASFVDATLMLDTAVVAFTEYNTLGGTLPDYLGKSRENYGSDAVSVGKLASPSVEQVVATKPDLIVSAKVRHEKIYPQLSQVAPTVFSETTGPTWKANIRMLAKALGKESLADQRIGEYETQARTVGDAVKAKAGANTTISVVRFVDGPTRLYANKSFSGIVLQDAGLARPAAQNVDSFTVEISPEQIPLADGSKIFLSINGDKGLDSQSSFTQNPLWTPLAPKSVEVKDSEWMSAVSVQGAYRILSDIAKAFDVPGPVIPAWIGG
ncbi:Periplasmic binding protein OS=Tsukamurella paurometabola (strain ATCC 8368 / DSM / CCUG 35730/ CIP 100753 / JCM 10117 / KCTC 9821 / NBRC 16120 / NCIMB 702349 / NCTC 13040) OX=521096 GN=Tpau_3865 PE=3 SV=1 [Tsukamurella paurometabola]|uniref:Periplasmic binding protein n=1 Tax=Tsukamurella paurometabola (strain ATCC 8368 / DSM 20162 / CCUG 35730 / CIP 100753 / JCM 10117 / KCTC 9821 / NBRC 16120 / NCIMB 702349 / NCTC 13040) TaxID=521096 RepID=D5UMG6_TSUPD|nr:iron-siderophore ABC transporter substrate-binding protein [Tsukamurella paurometabola]ADG80440.1 periplasmic binding protein [Tsukamurella paurometabola DSM 20162]SUP39648.1 Probable siderophore-binding lipoprotein yfiY precursor [Tsukamurella paurometabola]